MKKLEELKISPAPWDGVTFCHPAMNGYVVSNANLPEGDGRRKIVASDVRVNNARLIAAAPELYECLRELVVACGDVGYKDGGTAACYESEHRLYDVIGRAKSALAKAAGEGGEDK